MFFKNKKAEEAAWSLVALVALVAVVGMIVMFNGGKPEVTGAAISGSSCEKIAEVHQKITLSAIDRCSSLNTGSGGVFDPCKGKVVAAKVSTCLDGQGVVTRVANNFTFYLSPAFRIESCNDGGVRVKTRGSGRVLCSTL